MTDTLLKLLPVFSGLAIGLLLKRAKIAGLDEARTLFKFQFYVFVPALVFVSTSKIEITSHLLLFPLFALVAIVLGHFSGRAFVSKLGLAESKKVVFVLACTIVNSGFALLFLTAQFGVQGTARVVLFDLVGTTLIYSLAYGYAAKANPKAHENPHFLKKVLVAPPLWAMCLGLIVNVFEIDVPNTVMNVGDYFASPAIPVSALAVGLSIAIKKSDISTSLLAFSVRLVTGVIVAALVVIIFGLDGIDRAAVLVLGVAPVGFNTVTFASLEDLDIEFAAQTLSVSLVIGIFTSSLVLLIFG